MKRPTCFLTGRFLHGKRLLLLSPDYEPDRWREGNFLVGSAAAEARGESSGHPRGRHVTRAYCGCRSEALLNLRRNLCRCFSGVEQVAEPETGGMWLRPALNRYGHG
jgi:hypothetical protein